MASEALRAAGVVLVFAAIGLFVAGLLSGCDERGKREAFEGGADRGAKTIVYIPTIDDQHANSSELSMTSLFEDMFSFTSPHPTLEDRSASKVCDPFALDNSQVIAAAERAIRSLPAYKSAAVRVVSLENAPSNSPAEFGCVARFAFAFASGIKGTSVVRASLKEVGCNQWVVTAVAEPEGKYCVDFKEKGTTC